jgi:hypothetical protein
MARNRFEQVDEQQPDAINLTLAQHSDGQVGTIHCPLTALGERATKDVDSGELPARDAISTAVKLANELKLAIVVLDPDGVWKKEWGDLYRYDDGE